MAVNLDGYVDVAERLVKFREAYPEGSIQFEWSWSENPDGSVWLVGKAFAFRTPDDIRPGHGSAWEQYPGKTPYTRGSELMNLETSCWGRAIAALGIETRRGIASKQEVEASQNRRFDDHGLPEKLKTPVGQARSMDEPTAKQLMALAKRASAVGVGVGDGLKFYGLLLGRDLSQTGVKFMDAMALMDMTKEQWLETSQAAGYKPVTFDTRNIERTPDE
jgi:hypothetical protein